MPAVDLLRPAFDAFWADCHSLQPILHRQSLLTALAGAGNGTSDLYGTTTPTALMYAAAACGARSVRAPGLSSAQRARLVRDFDEQARALVLAGYVGRQEGDARRMSMLEAAQTLCLVVENVITLGDMKQDTAADSIDAATVLVRQLCFEGSQDGSDLVFSARKTTPLTASDWIRDDSKIRIFILTASMEAGLAHWSVREPVLWQLAEDEIPLPSPDALWDHSDPEEAFEMLYGDMNLASGLAAVDFAPFRADPTVLEGTAIAEACLRPIFEGRAGFLSICCLFGFLRSLSAELRKLAASAKIDGLAVAIADCDPSVTLDSSAEVDLYRAKTALVDAIVDSMPSFFPEPLGLSIAHGDAAPVFSSNLIFQYPSHAHSFLNFLFNCLCMPLEHFTNGSPPSTQPINKLFTSPLFPILATRASCALRLLESTSQHDPHKKWKHFVGLFPCLKLGTMFLACTRSVGVQAAVEAGYDRDVSVVCDALDTMANVYGPAMRRIAGEFRDAAVEGGLLHPVAPEDIKEEEEGGWLPTTGIRSGMIQAGSPGEKFVGTMGLLDLSMEVFLG
jgi:hypothetical protein